MSAEDTPHPLNTAFTLNTLAHMTSLAEMRGYSSPAPVAKMAVRWYLDGVENPAVLSCMLDPFEPPDLARRNALPISFLIIEKDWQRLHDLAVAFNTESVSDVVRVSVYSLLGSAANRNECALHVLDNLGKVSGFHERCV